MTKAPRPAAETPTGLAVDLTREGDHLLMTIALPGLKAGDFRLTLVGARQVHIEGTIPYAHPVSREHLTLAERVYGPFSRTVSLPFPVNAAQADLSFRDGVLVARLPITQTRVPLNWQRTEDGYGTGPR